MNVDAALAQRAAAGNPLRVGLVGAGFAARGLVNQVLNSTPGMEIVAVCNRTGAHAEQAYRAAGVSDFIRVETAAELEKAISAGRHTVTDDPSVVCEAGTVEVVVEATGEIDFGATVALTAIENGKHLVLVNAELDATLGPILKVYSDRAGVILTDTDGDQPGALMNLVRETQLLGFRTLLAGNIKSLLDHYRTPETQKAFAEAVFQRPKMITSFADGTKIAAEMATLGNGLGFGVGVRGMAGPPCDHVEQAASLFDVSQLLEQSIVDYILGAEPSFGIFVLGYSEQPMLQRYMRIYKMGDGPVYTFYRPFHLGPLETPVTIARAGLLGDATLTPAGAPTCDVIALAKRDVSVGETLDGVGGFTCYGVIENTADARRGDLLPMGLTDGCVLVRDVAKDEALTFADVRLPADRLCDRLWHEQVDRFHV
ncbi:MAG: Gfo/Idh/MocA family oxidoreductase [Chloroflexota bacterium]|nr:Gfo/Idh/MocA family oxidoreductase [Chloroflexota bacterium]